MWSTRTETSPSIQRTDTYWAWHGGAGCLLILLYCLVFVQPRRFTVVADALERGLLRDGLSWSIHYSDDFQTASCAGTDECTNNLRTIKSTCERLGVPLKWSKVEGPTTQLTFLGIVRDTLKGEIRLPQEKRGQLASLVSAWSHRKAYRKLELLSLIGKLAHARKVVKHGRTFLRRMIDTAQRALQLDHWIHLTPAWHLTPQDLAFNSEIEPSVLQMHL